jgi:malonate-semialdehyde dehydrogenase (acetylating)/methylmalonate-semialdehyde dehydrogenase
MVASVAPVSTTPSHTVQPFTGRDHAFAHAGTARNWLGGRLVDSASGQTLPVLNPRYGKVMGDVVLSGTADVQAAVEAAKKALPHWKAAPLKERAAVMYRFKALLERDLDELCWLLSAENGKTYAESKGDIEKGIECVEFACSLPNLGQGGTIEVSRGVTCETRYEPVGIVGGIVPFNFPVMVPLWMIPNALTAGNAFLCKPSESVPFGAMRIGQLLQEAGLPDGLYATINGSRDAVEALVDHPDVEAIGFVGSTKVAKLLYGRAANLGKRALCLGGAKNHVLVVPDADLDLTASNVVASSFGCAGQRCMASSLMVAIGPVQRHIDAMVAVTQKIKLGTDMGAIVSAEAVVRIHRYIDEAERMGATVLVDGRKATVPGCEGGFWVGPTILDHVRPDMPAGCDEIFGPVLSIVRVATLDEAIALENASHYGNGAAIFTTSGAVARYAAERLQSGMVGVNIGVPVPREPFSFGGWGDSRFGVGDITGWDGYRFWSKSKKITSKWALQTDGSWMS